MMIGQNIHTTPYASLIHVGPDEHIIKIGGLLDVERDASLTNLIGRLVAAKELELLCSDNEPKQKGSTK